MENHTLTVADIMIFFGLISAVLTLWWRVETRVSAGARAAMDKAEKLEATLHAYKLEVAEKYAKNEFIADVEKRVLGHIETLAENVNGLRKDVMSALSTNPRRRT